MYACDKRGINLEENKKRYMGGFGGKEGKGRDVVTKL